MEDILVPIAFFASCVFIVYFAMQSKMKRLKMEHEERMLAMERGIPVPPRRQEVMKNPYKWPIILIGLGLAWLAASVFQGDEDFFWALFPLIIGIGLIYAHQRTSREQPTPVKGMPEMKPTNSASDQMKPGAD